MPDTADPQAWNRYAYTYNNPLRYTDSTGHKVDESGGISSCKNNDCYVPPPEPPVLEVALITANEFLLGLEAQLLYNNSFGVAKNLDANPNESTAMSLGRIAGNVVTIGQGVGEASAGLGMMGGGVAVCLTGVGCVATPVLEVAGAASLAHGVAVGVQGTVDLANDIYAMTSQGSGGRTSHGSDRHSQGDRPTSEALQDRNNPREVYYDNHTGNTIYVGKNGRTHVFTPDGQHHTSFTTTRKNRIQRVIDEIWTRQ